MKILQIASFKLGACGPTSVLIPVIKRLNEKGHIVDVFSPYVFDENKNMKIDSLGSNYYYKEKRRSINKDVLLRDIPELNTYDVVHIHGIFNIDHIIIARILYKMKIPYIVSLHGNLMENALQHSKFKKKVALNLFIKNMLQKAATLHVLAKEEEVDIIKAIGETRKYSIIHNGVEPSSYSNLLRESSNGMLNILFIGRIDVHHKGIDILFKALENLDKKWKGKICLYLVGPFDSTLDEELVSNFLVNNDNLREMVKIEGPKYGEEKQEYYNKCDLFIHTSRYEGMPMAVLEAMQSGLPCLVTNATNMGSIMKESNGGFVINLNVNSIVDTIHNILNNPKEDLKLYGVNARQWCNENLNWNNITDRYEEMYCETVMLRN